MCKNHKRAFFVGPWMYTCIYYVFKWFGVIDIWKYRKNVLPHLTGKVVDVAMSDCRNVDYYSFDNVSEVTFIDIDQNMLDLVKKRRSSDSFKYLISDAQNLSELEDGSVDNFVSFFLYSCGLDDPLKAYEEAYRVLKKGGQLILLCHIPSKKRFMKPIEFVADNFVDFFAGPENPQDVIEDIEAAGFKILKSEIPGFIDICRIVVAVK